jgi:hypothetical protein
MQALPFVKQVRSRLQAEIAALPKCVELERTERALGIYEQIIIQRGLQKKDIGPKAHKAFDHLIAVAREAYKEDKVPQIKLEASERAAHAGASSASSPASASGSGVAGAPFARWLRSASAA